MPTRAGWRLLFLGLTALLGGRALGLVEFYVIGLAAVAAVLLAQIVRLLHPSHLRIERSISSPLMAVSDHVTVSISATNRSSIKSPTVRLAEPVSDGTQHEFLVASLPGGASATGRYHLPGRRRGVLEVGPAVTDDIDGLSLARRRRRHPPAQPARVIVHPPIHRLRSSPVPASGSMAARNAVRRRTLGQQSDDFDFLRPYVSGDDPRHVHWRSTARFDDLMVRRFRHERPGRLTVLIDTRPPGHLVETQDLTTSVAASVLSAVLAGSDEARLATTDGRGTGPLAHRSQLVEALEFLALLEGGSDDIDAAALHGGPLTDGSLVVAVSAAPEAINDPAARAALAGSLRASLLITCAAPAVATPAPEAASSEAVVDTGLPRVPAASVLAASPVAGADPSGRWIHLTEPAELVGLWRMPQHSGGARTAVGAAR